MNKREDAMGLLNVLGQAVVHFEDKLSREVSLELVEHFVESSRTIDRILGLASPMNGQAVEQPRLKLEMPKPQALAAPESEPPVEEPPAVEEPQQLGQVVCRDGKWGKIIHTSAHLQTWPDGRSREVPASSRFYPFPPNSKDWKKYNQIKPKTPRKDDQLKTIARATGDDIITGPDGRIGRMVHVSAWTSKDGKEWPAHDRFRPLGKKSLEVYLATKNGPQPDPEGRPGVVIVNGVAGRMIRIPPHNKMIGTKFVMMPGREQFYPLDRAPRSPRKDKGGTHQRKTG